MFKHFLDDFYDVLFRPQTGMLRVADKRNIWQGLSTYIGASIILSLSTLNVTLPYDLIKDMGLPIPLEVAQTLSWFLPVISVIITVVFGPLIFFLGVAIINFIAELFGGKGNVARLGATFGYARLPYIFVAIVSLFGLYFPFNIINLATFVAFVWSSVLKIIGIREAHHFSTGRSVIVYLIPAIAVFVAFLIFLMLFIVFLMPSFYPSF